jgi:hypothetical protein
MLTVQRERELGQAVTPAAKPVKAKQRRNLWRKSSSGGEEGGGSQSGSQETGCRKTSRMGPMADTKQATRSKIQQNEKVGHGREQDGEFIVVETRRDRASAV